MLPKLTIFSELRHFSVVECGQKETKSPHLLPDSPQGQKVSNNSEPHSEGRLIENSEEEFG